MRKPSLPIFATLLASLLSACNGGDDDVTPPDAAGQPDVAPPATKRLVILHTNDEHSHLFGFAPEIDDFPVATTAGNGDIIGNVARRAQVLADERAAAAGAGADTLTVSAGDETQGALPQMAFTATSPDFTIMRTLGYDVMTPGNHEFDLGPGAFAQSIMTAMANGGLPQLISTNIHFDATSAADDTLEALYGEGTSTAPIKRYHVITTPGGIKVGLFGVMGIQASYYAPLKVPVRFSALSAEEGDQALGLPRLYADIQPTIDELRNVEMVDVVVMVSHGGVDTITPTIGDDYQVAEDVSGIDVIISGHSHTPLQAPQVVTSPDGHETPVVQAGSFGEWVGRVELVLEPGLRPALDATRTGLIKVDDTIIPTDQAILDELTGIVDSLESDGSPSILEGMLARIEGAPVVDDPGVLGDLYFRDMGSTAFDVPGLVPFHETNILNLSTDAMLAQADQAGFTLLAVQASGSVRGDIVVGQTGVMSFADLFRIFPLGMNPVDGSIGYPLCRFYLWAIEVKAAFEVAASEGLIADAVYLSPSGVRVEFDTDRPAFDFSNPFDPNNGRVTRILFDPDHTDGLDDFTPANYLFDLSQPDPWGGPLGGVVSLHPVVTSLYVASFAATAGVTLKDAMNNTVTLESTIMTRLDGSDIKDYEAFIGYIQSESAANGGMLPSRYDEATVEGAVPRRMMCSGALCP